MNRNLSFVALLSATLLGCSGTEPVRLAPSEPVAVDRVGVRYKTIAVREVSLPTHASSEDIAVSGPLGTLTGIDALWSDDPVRAVTLDVARALTDITRAQVAPEPWPFESFPDVTVDIRLERLLPTSDGTYVARGMAFVAPGEGLGRERTRSLDLSVAFDPEGGAVAIAAARAALIQQLALDVARNGLR